MTQKVMIRARSSIGYEAVCSKCGAIVIPNAESVRAIYNRAGSAVDHRWVETELAAVTEQIKEISKRCQWEKHDRDVSPKIRLHRDTWERLQKRASALEVIMGTAP